MRRAQVPSGSFALMRRRCVRCLGVYRALMRLCCSHAAYRCVRCPGALMRRIGASGARVSQQNPPDTASTHSECLTDRTVSPRRHGAQRAANNNHTDSAHMHGPHATAAECVDCASAALAVNAWRRARCW